MTKFFRLNLAVPDTTLLKDDGSNKLAFDTKSWMHLKRYVSKVENLPAEFNGGSVVTGEALTKLRSEAGSFGSPKGLRQLITGNPNALADDTPPSMLYAAMVWLVQYLHESAAFTVTTLQNLLKSAGSENVKESLLLLGRKADNARNPISSLSARLGIFKEAIIGANSTLSEACKADAELLHRKQEGVGALQVRIEGVQKKIDRLGFLSSAKKRKELEQELAALQQELKETMAQSEKLRAAVGEFESILEDGYWLKSSLDDLIGFLDNLRKVWTVFGSGLTQLAADASDAQLGDLDWVKKALGLDKAIKQWNAIDQVAKQFVVNSLVDIPTD